jgi:hypothetical protein
LNYWREAISDGLPDEYEARLDERVSLIDLDDEGTRLMKPDIAVLRQEGPRRQVGGRGAAVMEPAMGPAVILDQGREGFIKILHRPDRKLVAVLELLSPANKLSPSRRDYLTRRNAIFMQDIHLIELDLLFVGEGPPMGRPMPTSDFCGIVSRTEARPLCEVYAWSIRESLPTLPIPLRAPDPDLLIDLAAVYRTAFVRGKYARSIDDTAPLDLPLAPEDRAWAEALAREPRA